mgnify:CR=1 FL=1
MASNREGKYITSKMVKSICYQNGRTLQVLNLSFCSGLDLESIQDITKNCVGLKNVDLSSTGLSKESINFLVHNLTHEVEKLNLGRLLNLKDKHVISLSKRCNRMISLDLSRTLITDISLSSVILNLNSSLEQIDIEETKISVDKLLVLRSIPTLIVLNHSFEDLEGGQFSGFIRKNIEIAT